MKKIVYSIAVAFASGLAMTSCSNDFTETKFFQEEKAGSITTVEQLQSFLNGTFAKMRASAYLGSSYRGYAEVHSDEMYCTQNSGRNVLWATYALTSNTADVANTWAKIYEVVANANVIINTPDNLTWSVSSDNTRVNTQIKYIKGQAYALRAQAFFDLLRLYGQKYSGGNLGVVLPLEFNATAKQGRATIAETEAQIEADFQKALEYLGTTGLGNTIAKNNLNKYSVESLMTRYYLYKGDYARVRELTESVINSGRFSVIPAGDLQASFAKEAPQNSVFELSVGLNGALGTTSYDYLMSGNGYANIATLSSAKNLYEVSDIRLGLIDSDNYLTGKFNDLTGATNIKVVRYEEVLLNAIEAQLNSGGDSAKALTYYNLIRQNRGLSAATAITMTELKNERVRELIGEGFRYWDLLRWGDVIPGYTSAGARQSTATATSKIQDRVIGDQFLAFPIPRQETTVPGSLVEPNPGYDN